ncbi:hypothetical protein [Pseudomonas viridiflava]|uniref:hypothetical protein n=1 Tax=Pseudomonas viridiflava TaxID=33069 RepID=UPI000F035127|nr:hypothetical protein [Pseudomonas viridiflava]
MEYFHISQEDGLIFVQMIIAGLFGGWLGWTLWYVNALKKVYEKNPSQDLKVGRRVRMTIFAILLLVGVVIGIGAALLVLMAEWHLLWTTFAAVVFSMAPGKLVKLPTPSITP